MRWAILLILAFIAGAYGGVGFGETMLRETLLAERQRAMALCSAGKGLGTYFVLKEKGTWHCFYEQPAYPHRIKRGVLIGVERNESN